MNRGDNSVVAVQHVKMQQKHICGIFCCNWGNVFEKKNPKSADIEYCLKKNNNCCSHGFIKERLGSSCPHVTHKFAGDIIVLPELFPPQAAETMCEPRQKVSWKFFLKLFLWFCIYIEPWKQKNKDKKHIKYIFLTTFMQRNWRKINSKRQTYLGTTFGNLAEQFHTFLLGSLHVAAHICPRSCQRLNFVKSERETENSSLVRICQWVRKLLKPFQDLEVTQYPRVNR